MLLLTHQGHPWGFLSGDNAAEEYFPVNSDTAKYSCNGNRRSVRIGTLPRDRVGAQSETVKRQKPDQSAITGIQYSESPYFINAVLLKKQAARHLIHWEQLHTFFHED